MMTRIKDAPGVDISYTISASDCCENNEDGVSLGHYLIKVQ